MLQRTCFIYILTIPNKLEWRKKQILAAQPQLSAITKKAETGGCGLLQRLLPQQYPNSRLTANLVSNNLQLPADDPPRRPFFEVIPQGPSSRMPS